MLTGGKDPAVAVAGDVVYELQAPALETADHRGAGDSMTAALAAGVAGREDWETVLVRATAAGAANVTRHGLGTSWASEVKALEPHVRLAPIGR